MVLSQNSIFQSQDFEGWIFLQKFPQLSRSKSGNLKVAPFRCGVSRKKDAES